MLWSEQDQTQLEVVLEKLEILLPLFAFVFPVPYQKYLQ
jgi:hypothetical protein